MKKISYLLILLNCNIAMASWDSFRDGGSSESASPLPLHWTPGSGIRWQRERPGYGQSSPVARDGRVYVSAVIGPEKDECCVVSLELSTGNQRWMQKIDATATAPSDYMHARAAPTPVVDGHRVYAFFESGDLMAVDRNGALCWQRSLTEAYGPFENGHGLGSSPAQTPDTIILNIEHRGPSYLIAIDKATGQTRWKVARDSSMSWTSPVVVERGGDQVVVVSSGGSVKGYRAETGESLWSLDGLSGNSVSSPTPAGDQLIIGARLPEFGTTADAAGSNLCLRLDRSSHGFEVTWRASKAVCDYASPIVAGKCVYLLTKIGVLHCLDRETGASHYSARLGTQCWATPIVANERLYFFGKDGRTRVVQAGPRFAILATNDLWDQEAPPKPESYTETSRASSSENGVPSRGSADRRRQANPSSRGGMVAALLENDADGDGVLSSDEIPNQFRSVLQRIDTNGDGALDQEEMKAMAASFRARRAGSRESSRDPIVYGVAATDGSIVIRTGTRLYAISESAGETP